MKKLKAYISWAILLIQLNKALAKDAQDLHANILCLAAGIHTTLKDGKITKEELNILNGCVADTAASLVTLFDSFTIPEEPPAKKAKAKK